MILSPQIRLRFRGTSSPSPSAGNSPSMPGGACCFPGGTGTFFSAGCPSFAFASIALFTSSSNFFHRWISSANWCVCGKSMNRTATLLFTAYSIACHSGENTANG